MAITYTWNKKKLAADYFGNVHQINFERKGVDGSYTELANAILVIPEDDQEHADKWTESRVDALAETRKTALDAEAAAIYDAIDAIIEDTKFNGVDLLGFSVKSHAVAVADDGGAIYLKTSNGFTSVSDYNEAAGAEVTADIILSEVATDLGNVAAGMSAFKARQSVAYSASANLSAAASRIEDTDIARESANLTRMAILNQSAMAMVAQANKATGAFLNIINS